MPGGGHGGPRAGALALRTVLCDMLGMRYPIIQDGMGPFSTAALAAAVSDAGVDVVIASGYEMGGHTHARPVHTMVLAPQVIDAVEVPVVVSGGIHDGRGLAAALAMGAAGVGMGTRFIATLENDWHPAYKKAIVDAAEWQDVVFPG